MKNTDDWFGNEAPLNHRFAIYLPSCEQEGQPIDDLEAFANSTSRMLCDIFGGVTRYPAKGLYQRKSGTPQGEEIIVLESFCDSEQWTRESGFLRAWVRVLSALLRQESIACSLDGNMSFVPPGELQGEEPAIDDQEAMRRFVSASIDAHAALASSLSR
jgi:hypothetical protein